MPNINKEQQLQRIVDKYVKAYKSDFDYDKQTLSVAEKGDKFLWIVRLHGTHLINKNKVVNDETLQYWREHNNVDGEQDVKYYEIDADTWKPTAIHNIDDYYNQCKTDYEYQQMYKDEYDLKDDIEVVVDRPLEILGDTKVNAVRFKDKEIESDGVFVLRDSISPGQLVPGLLMENGHIKVDRTMATNIPGCFAAGDCVGVPYQYIKSAGEGNIAALSAVKYLDGLAK